MKISIVTPMYNESKSISSFMKSIVHIIDKLNCDYEVVCINDGSNDDTLNVLKKTKSIYPKMRIVNLTRNFGKEAALSAGLSVISGDFIIPIDADLQDPPELIPMMVDKANLGFDIVLAKRTDRASDSFIKRFTASAFYKLIGSISKTKIPYNVGDYRLMTKRVVEVINNLPETQRFMKGLFAWAGFNTTTIEYERKVRFAGVSQFNMLSLWNLAVEGITSFSLFPLKVSSFFGLIISFLSMLYAVYIVLRTIIQGVDLPGYASLLVSILFLGGIQLICLGILGEYIGRIYMETKKRPLFIIENEY